MNKTFTKSLVSLTTLAMVAMPVTSFAQEGRVEVKADGEVRANLGSFLRKFTDWNRLDVETRKEIKAEAKAEAREIKAEAKAEAKANARLKTSSFPGTVSTVNTDGSFTVNGDNGKQVKVTTTSSTTVKNRNTSGTLADVKADSKVVVRGTWNADKTVLAATEIRIVDSTMNPIRAWFQTLFAAHIVTGTVSAVNGNTVTVVSENNTSYNVDIINAKILGRNVFVNQSASDIKVGDKLQVFGNVSGTSVSANIVHDLTVQK